MHKAKLAQCCVLPDKPMGRCEKSCGHFAVSVFSFVGEIAYWLVMFCSLNSKAFVLMGNTTAMLNVDGTSEVVKDKLIIRVSTGNKDQDRLNQGSWYWV